MLDPLGHELASVEQRSYRRTTDRVVPLDRVHHCRQQLRLHSMLGPGHQDNTSASVVPFFLLRAFSICLVCPWMGCRTGHGLAHNHNPRTAGRQNTPEHHLDTCTSAAAAADLSCSTGGAGFAPKFSPSKVESSRSQPGTENSSSWLQIKP